MPPYWRGQLRSSVCDPQEAHCHYRAQPGPLFHGPDPEDPLSMRAYIGEADSVRDRIDTSAKSRDFWETAIVVTTSDEAINKGHARYLEARLIEMAREGTER